MMIAVEGILVYKCYVGIGGKVSCNEGPVFIVIDWKESQFTITDVSRIENLSVKNRSCLSVFNQSLGLEGVNKGASDRGGVRA